MVIHDDMEMVPFALKRRAGGMSARGHNGLKSIMASMPQQLRNGWERVGVGIPRPNSRERGHTADHVLSKMTRDELAGLTSGDFLARVVKLLEAMAAEV